jgi:protein tyrosine phosphatase (PTP) superfamily phosphohydrolase (DUF442 family)
MKHLTESFAVAPQITDADIAKFAAALRAAHGPLLGHCRSGTRAGMLWALAQAGPRRSFIPAVSCVKG